MDLQVAFSFVKTLVAYKITTRDSITDPKSAANFHFKMRYMSLILIILVIRKEMSIANCVIIFFLSEGYIQIYCFYFDCTKSCLCAKY